MFTAATVFSALELGFIYALVAMALFLSFRILNIADMSTDGTFTLGCDAEGIFTGLRGLGYRCGGRAPGAGAVSGHCRRCSRRLRHRVSANEAGRAVDPGRYHHQYGAVHRQPGGHGLFFQRADAQDPDDLYRRAGVFR